MQGINLKRSKVFCYGKFISNNKMIAEMEIVSSKEDLIEEKCVTNVMEKLEREILHFYTIWATNQIKLFRNTSKGSKGGAL